MPRSRRPFDGSEAAAAALAWAVDEARLHHAEITVWTVLDQRPAGPAAEATGEVDAPEKLSRAVEGIANGFPVAFRQAYGGAAAELNAACANADLLVVGSRGRNAFTGLMLGSVSRACLSHAPCSVAVVRPQPHPVQPHGRVLVGIDTSDYARRALHVAAEEARLHGAALHAIHVMQGPVHPQLIKPVTRQLLAWGEQLVAAELAGTGVAAHPEILIGHAADVLVRQGDHADLLILGSRGHNPLASLLLGSTSDYCAQHAKCPVMVVRPERRGRTTKPGREI